VVRIHSPRPSPNSLKDHLINSLAALRPLRSRVPAFALARGAGPTLWPGNRGGASLRTARPTQQAPGLGGGFQYERDITRLEAWRLRIA
jgi:hypothetical protein